MQLDIERIIDGARLGPLHGRVLGLCALAAFLDGYDVAVMASATPSLAADWHVPPGELRWIVTAAVIGIAASALIVSPLGDYLGRRSVLLASFAVVGLSTLGAATAASGHTLFVWRLLAGVGLGASLPNALAMAAEYVPARSRTAMVALLACGISLGSATSGLLAPFILQHGGWRAIFATGGLIALLAWIPLLALPESLRFLAARGRHSGAGGRDPAVIGSLLERLDTTYRYVSGHEFTTAERPASGLPVRQLLTSRLAPATLLLWLVFFLNLGLLYLLSAWLPTLLTQGGLPLAQALRTAAMFQIGGVLGGFVLASLMQRWGPFLVLCVSYILTAIALAMLGTRVSSPILLICLILVTGNGIHGGQVALNAVSATLYPTQARATGVGWALGVGRFGAIAGPLGAGFLMAAGVDVGRLFRLATAPALICAVAVILLRLAVVRSGEPPARGAAPVSH